MLEPAAVTGYRKLDDLLDTSPAELDYLSSRLLPRIGSWARIARKILDSRASG